MGELFSPAPFQTAFLDPGSGYPSFPWIQWFGAIGHQFNLLAQRPNVFSGQAMIVQAGSNNLVNTVNAPPSLTVTMTLPPIANQYLPIRFIKTSPDANTVTITVANPVTESINAGTTKVLSSQFQGCTLVPDGLIRWYVF